MNPNDFEFNGSYSTQVFNFKILENIQWRHNHELWILRDFFGFYDRSNWNTIFHQNNCSFLLINTHILEQNSILEPKMHIFARQRLCIQCSCTAHRVVSFFIQKRNRQKTRCNNRKFSKLQDGAFHFLMQSFILIICVNFY